VERYWDTSPIYDPSGDPLFVPLNGISASAGENALDGCNVGSGKVNLDCATTVDTAKILCAARAYEGIWYQFGGGHMSPDIFRQNCPDPTHPPNNRPSGRVAIDGSNGNPSPCAVDCSSLVSLAVDDAFGQNFMWTVGTIVSSNPNWKRVNLDEAQPGDIATVGDHHVEILVSHSATTITTFGAHQTGTQTGESTVRAASGYYDSYWHYIGPTK
jgi:hypothetical protein